MIVSIKLINIQGHKKSILRFHQGMNVIVGTSNHGKSAIIKAINWVFRNKPSTKLMRSKWGGNSKVVIENQNDVIIRQEGDDRCYQLLSIAEPFRAFGQEVPKEILDALNLDEINIQRQLDSHFLLSNTPGDVAKFYNRIANFDQIDLGLSRTSVWSKKATEQLNNARENFTNKQAQLERFENLEKLQADYEVLEDLNNQLEKKQKSLSDCNKLISSFEKIESKLEKYKFIDEAKRLLNLIEETSKKQYQLMYDLEQIEFAIDNLEQIEEKLEKLKSFTKNKSLINSTYQLMVSKKDLNDQLSDLQYIIQKYENVSRKLKIAQDQYMILHDQYEKEYPDICPFCNSKIKKK
jgi:exonuclease SbcC